MHQHFLRLSLTGRGSSHVARNVATPVVLLLNFCKGRPCVMSRCYEGVSRVNLCRVVLLDCEAVWTCRQVPTFRRNILSSSSAPNVGMKLSEKYTVSIFRAKGGQNRLMFLRNVGIYRQVYAAS